MRSFYTAVLILLSVTSLAFGQPVRTQDSEPWRVSPDGLVKAKTLQRDDNASMGLLQFSKGARVPLHRHPKSTELLYIRSGTGSMTVDGLLYEIKPGSVISVPQGAEHSFTADSDGEAVQVYAPAGPEQRFQKWELRVEP